MKVSQFLQWVNTIAPFDTACSFDNVGLLVGNPEADIHKVGLALDVTIPLIRKAEQEDIRLILTHHPVIFNPVKQVLADSPVYQLIRSDISCIAAHTNLDQAEGGTNDQMGIALGFQNVESPAFLENLGRTAFLSEPMALKELAEKIKEVSHASAVRYYDAGRPVQRVAWVAGSGGSELEAVLAEGFDTFLTGDLKHDRFVLAENQGINLVEWNHYDAEHLVLRALKKRIEEELSLETVVLRDENILRCV